MKFAITTLGCKVNQYDSQRIKEALRSGGHEEQSFTAPGADCYIINTCSVTHRSDADGRKLVRQALRHGGRVIVTGCQAAVYPGDIQELSETVEVIPYEDLASYLGVVLPSAVTGFEGHSRAFVQVQGGCDNFCTYCIVPHARGKPWSRPWEDIVSEINMLSLCGYKEVVLCGINIGLFEGGLTALIHRILAHTSIPRVRISSVEPWTVEDELIEIVSQDPRVCKHLHLPLQSGSDRILSGMGRPYTAGYYRDLVSKVRSASVDVAIGSDIMVGFPGEDQSCFGETNSLLQDLDITYLHVFPYSARPGTPAATYASQVDAAVKRDRARILRDLSRKKRDTFIRSQVGSTGDVIVTNTNGDSFSGITSNYLRVHVTGSAAVNDLVRICLVDYAGGVVTGRACG
ncbi:MAG TPA: MiaB/RimO family radical SAM methylthiotransferase [Deltaproteobacteria bacterium]|nr:MiaB/RimO family radical SAM methylthiotransferase [Deltaproteobacteria bacterium]